MSLDILFPEGKQVTISGEMVTVKPFTFGQFPKAAKLLQPVVALFSERGVLAVGADGLQVSDSWPVVIVSVLADGGESVIDLCAFVSGKPREFFDTVSLDEGAELAKAVFEVNADFFKARILPKLGVAMDTVLTGSTPLTP